MTKDEKWLLEEKYDGVASKEFEADRLRLAAGEPVAYVIGWQPFLGLSIHLDSHPLIPRPETEWWTRELADELRSGKYAVGSTQKEDAQLKILDLCAGSGAIGCALLNAVPNAHVSFGEIDETHEVTIRKNIVENHLDESRADVRIGDLFEPFALEKFDIIATNPPYIPETRTLPESVIAYEPELALRAGADGLSLIRRIAAEAKTHLVESGEMWLECDSEHAEETHRLLLEGGARYTAIRTDPYGRPRLIVGYF